jgi:hypothetical protein
LVWAANDNPTTDPVRAQATNSMDSITIRHIIAYLHL